jgi:L-ribulokinase
MAIVAGVDFGTLSVRVTLVDSKTGPIGTASASYPLHRRRDDPNYATQSHADQMAALAAATKDVLKATGVNGAEVAAIALDTTGSSVIPVGKGLEPLDEYYLWCDHRAFAEAEEITRKAHELGFEGIDGAAASTRTNGALPNCCTGCATTRRSATVLSPRSNTATWLRLR